MLDEDRCYRVVSSRDERFDGTFVVAVTSTGIYCRPSCPARTPQRRNTRYFRTAAAAQLSGFRACRRCQPDASPGSPEWDIRADTAARAMRLLADGVVDRQGVAGLAARLGYSERHLHRLLVHEVGAGPQALARAQRAQTARVLLETTGLASSDVAFAAGFGSIRQFNDTVRAVFAATPTELRRGRRGPARPPEHEGPPDAGRPPAPGTVVLRLAYRSPLDAAGLLGFLAARAVPGVEEVVGSTYRRTLALPHGDGVAELTPLDGHVCAVLTLTDLRDLTVAVTRCRRLFDLDADPHAVAAVLDADPVLRPLVRAAPGRRSPGVADGAELAVRAVLGQRVSVAAACTLAARLVAKYGRPLARPHGALTATFPTPEVLAGADPADLPVPTSRGRALVGLAAALADGALVLDAGADRDAAEAALLTVPGVGSWTAAYVRMRALGDPDVFLPSDLGVRRALAGAPGPVDVARWRPWRSYAVHHLWAARPPARRDRPENRGASP